MTRAVRAATASAVALAMVAVAQVLPASAAPPPEVEPCPSRPEATCVSGTLDDGTAYRFAVPEDWDGTVVVDLDFAGGSPDAALAALPAAMLDQGVAYGGTTRDVTGWNIAQAIDNQAQALAIFEETVGEATHAIASGSSMGGFVSAGAAQVHPDAFDGAVPFCGGLGGSVAQWNQKLDTVFVLKELLFPDEELPVLDIPEDVTGAQQAWISALSEAQHTAEGRARIALAASIGQLPPWGLTGFGRPPVPRPDADDAEALQEGMFLALAGGPLPYIGQAMSSRRTLTALSGGNPSWNVGVDYAEQLGLADPAHRAMVEELYAAAGLSLDDDLATLAAAPRIEPDVAAVHRFARGIVFDGGLQVPVLTVSNIGDQISTVAQQDAYQRVVEAAGREGLLRQTYVETAGHCTFSTGERQAALDAMIQRLDTGEWPDVTPGALNAAVADLEGTAGRYLDFTPERFNRPFTPDTPVPGAPERVSAPGVYEGYSPVLYDEWVRTSEYVPMRDGTRLAVDIYRPAVDGAAVDTPYPVIWEHQLSRASVGPDGEPSLAAVRSGMAELTRYGYVVALADRRGNGASFGSMIGYHPRTEAEDAYDLMEWFAAQPWAQENIGVYGCSNTGEAAMHAATAGSAHLKAVFAGNYSFHKFDGLNRGGIRANWGVGPNRTLEQDLTNLPVDGDEDGALLYQAALEHQENTSLRDMWRAAPYRDSHVDMVDARPWEDYSVATFREVIEESGVALYSWDGWQDDFRKEVFVSAANLTNPHKVLVGPWGHCGTDGFDMVTEQLRFFDHWLKGVDNGIMDEPTYLWFTERSDGTGEWVHEEEWPRDGAATVLHLGGGAGGTVDSVNDGVLTLDETTGSDEYTVDYDLTCPDPVGLGQTCPQSEHGLTYTTPPLAADLEVTGHPVLELLLASTAEDQDVFAYLEDVAPDGTVRIVTDGRLRASLRANHEAPWDTLGLPWHRSYAADAQPLVPGETAELAFDLLPLSHVFEAGHRIRLTLTGADVRESMREEVSPAPVLTVDRASALTLPTVGAPAFLDEGPTEEPTTQPPATQEPTDPADEPPAGTDPAPSEPAPGAGQLPRTGAPLLPLALAVALLLVTGAVLVVRRRTVTA